MSLAAQPADDTRWLAALRDLPREHGFEPLRVEGTLPAELTGTLYRTGPALFSRFGRRYRHWFDGDGAVSAVRFAGGRAHGAVKLVQSAGYLAEERAGRALYGGYGTRPPGLRRFRQAAALKNAGNTAMLAWRGRLFALFEPSPPTEIATADLATLGEERFGGVVRGGFSAHPHAVPARRAVYNFAARYGRRSALDLYELRDDDGQVRHLGSVPMPWPTMVHDFVATERHLVFVVGPVVLEPLGLLLGQKSFAESLRWDAGRGTQILVVPIDAPREVRRLDAPSMWVWHFANAFERGDELVVDVVRYPDFDSNAALAALSEARLVATAPGTLWRAMLAPATGRAIWEERWPGACEFPRVAPWVESRRHTLAFVAARASARAGAPLTDAIARVDVETGKASVWAAGALVSEPVVVPRPGARAEDDAWLLAHMYDAAQDRTCVVVLDARDPSAGPLGRAWFGQHVPPSFHGTFAV